MTDSIWNRIAQATGKTISIDDTNPLTHWFGSSPAIRNHPFESLHLTLSVAASKHLRSRLQEAGYDIEGTLDENLLRLSLPEIYEISYIGPATISSILVYLYELYIRDEEQPPLREQTLGQMYPKALEYESYPLESLDLSRRAYNCLRRFGYDTLGALCALTPTELKDIKNIGVHHQYVLDCLEQIATDEYVPSMPTQPEIPSVDALPRGTTLKYISIDGRLELCLVTPERPDALTILRPVPGMIIQVCEGELCIWTPES